MKKLLKVVVALVVLMNVLVVVGRLFIFTPYEVSGTSMNPTIADGQTVFLVEDEEYTHGEVVVIDSPIDEDNYIKRVVGVAGDHIQIKDGNLTVNGKLQEDKEFGKTITFYGIEEIDVVVPEGHVYLLGDNREESMDSRIFGTVPVEEIHGKMFQLVNVK